MATGPDSLEDSSLEEEFVSEKIHSPLRQSSDRVRKVRSAGLKRSRLSDLNSSIDAHKALCASMEKVAVSLRQAMNEVQRLERSERLATSDSSRLSLPLKEIASAVDYVLDRAAESLATAEKKESNLLDAHGRICSRMDVVARELEGALSLAALLDRSTGSGFNVEVRLNRRLNVPEIRKTLHAAHANIVRTAKMSRAKAGAQARIVEDIIDEAPAGFE